MGNTTEGIILTANSGIHAPWGPQEGDSFARTSRLAFINNIHKAIGDLNHPNTPIGIKPALQRLLLECDHYLAYGNEAIFIKLCFDAVEVCGQGWNYLSCWISTPQHICYSIYWALKAALERHQKEMLRKNPAGSFDSTNDPAFLSALLQR